MSRAVNCRFTEWSRRAPNDIDGQAGGRVSGSELVKRATGTYSPAFRKILRLRGGICAGNINHMAANGSETTIDPLWYKDAVIYELHVKTFCDSDGDGMGDFRGLIEKLD